MAVFLDPRHLSLSQHMPLAPSQAGLRSFVTISGTRQNETSGSGLLYVSRFSLAADQLHLSPRLMNPSDMQASEAQ